MWEEQERELFLVLVFYWREERKNREDRERKGICDCREDVWKLLVWEWVKRGLFVELESTHARDLFWGSSQKDGFRFLVGSLKKRETH